MSAWEAEPVEFGQSLTGAEQDTACGDFVPLRLQPFDRCRHHFQRQRARRFEGQADQRLGLRKGQPGSGVIRLLGTRHLRIGDTIRRRSSTRGAVDSPRDRYQCGPARVCPQA